MLAVDHSPVRCGRALLRWASLLPDPGCAWPGRPGAWVPSCCASPATRAAWTHSSGPPSRCAPRTTRCGLQRAGGATAAAAAAGPLLRMRHAAARQLPTCRTSLERTPMPPLPLPAPLPHPPTPHPPAAPDLCAGGGRLPAQRGPRRDGRRRGRRLPPRPAGAGQNAGPAAGACRMLALGRGCWAAVGSGAGLPCLRVMVPLIM